MHPDWLSNAYLVADEEGGAAVFVDSGADVAPLLAAAVRWRVEPSYVLRTHSHHDHVVHEAELGLPVRTDAVHVGGEEGTLIVWSPDYDGGGKAWVRFDDGRDAIVGGSRVARS